MVTEPTDEGTANERIPTEHVPDFVTTELDGTVKFDHPVNQTITLPSALVLAEPPQAQSPAGGDAASTPSDSQKG